MLRRIGVVAGAAALLVLLAGCVGAPAPERSPGAPLPLGIPQSVVDSCERGSGLGASAAITRVWRDSQGLHVNIGRGTQWAAGSGVSNTEYALLACLTTASGMTRSYPSDSAGLLLLWKYSVTSLWPCFAAHGARLAAVPSRADFLGADPVDFDPLFLLMAPLDPEQASAVRIACPLVPDYLRQGPA